MNISSPFGIVRQQSPQPNETNTTTTTTTIDSDRDPEPFKIKRLDDSEQGIAHLTHAWVCKDIVPGPFPLPRIEKFLGLFPEDSFLQKECNWIMQHDSPWGLVPLVREISGDASQELRRAVLKAIEVKLETPKDDYQGLGQMPSSQRTESQSWGAPAKSQGWGEPAKSQGWGEPAKSQGWGESSLQA
ncbi:hypothetical protein BGX23_010556 [Mortierella sp. AD031]|nr:hypothetical protein BGX23_010556 [Mortierella sp. AD031]